MKAPSKIVGIIAIVIGVFALIMITQFSQKVTTPKTDAELEQEAQEQAQKAQADAQKKNAPAATPSKAAAPGDSGTLVMLGQDATLGSQDKSAPEVTLQWSWTPQVEADPSKVATAISDIMRQMPKVRIHAINTDESEGTPDGIFYQGRQVTAAGPDGSIKFDSTALQNAMSQK
jgi:hypothetical protein